jgi:hypothetical protein
MIRNTASTLVLPRLLFVNIKATRSFNRGQNRETQGSATLTLFSQSGIKTFSLQKLALHLVTTRPPIVYLA